MKLEQQVVSLELSKRLKELGVKQESYFLWKKLSITGDFPDRWNLGQTSAWVNMPGIDIVSAFTVAELGEMLPKNRLVYSFSGFAEGPWACSCARLKDEEHREYADTEADARAKMLIYLLENKLITL